MLSFPSSILGVFKGGKDLHWPKKEKNSLKYYCRSRNISSTPVLLRLWRLQLQPGQYGDNTSPHS
jgi:hypothetical protein